jgi:hypothetical protein
MGSSIADQLRKAGHSVGKNVEKTLEDLEKHPEDFLTYGGTAVARNLTKGRGIFGGKGGGIRNPFNRPSRPAAHATHPLRDLLMTADDVGASVPGAQPFTIPSKRIVAAGSTFAGTVGGNQGTLVADMWTAAATPDFQTNYTFPWPFISKRMRWTMQAEPVDASVDDADSAWLEGLHVIFSIATEISRTSLDLLGRRVMFNAPAVGAASSAGAFQAPDVEGVEWDVYYEKNGTYKMQVYTSLPIANAGTTKAIAFSSVLDGWIIQSPNLLNMNVGQIQNNIADLLGGSVGE